MPTAPIITASQAEPTAYFIPTITFRWLRRKSGTEIILQQMYQGSDGTQRWEDVPTVDETQS